jgi:hypothetical protein
LRKVHHVVKNRQKKKVKEEELEVHLVEYL